MPKKKKSKKATNKKEHIKVSNRFYNILTVIVIMVYIFVIIGIVVIEKSDIRYNRALYKERSSVQELQNKVYELEQKIENMEE